MDIAKAFFEQLDLEKAGLEKVKNSIEKAEYDKAGQQLLDYYRNRNIVNYYDGWDNRKLVPNYDTSKADEICENKLAGVDMGSEINWQADPYGDPEWKYTLHRHEYLTTLGRAYWYTGDEKYTKAFKRILSDWIDKNPPHDLDWMIRVHRETSRSYFMDVGTWRPLTVGIRIYTALVPCFCHFIDSPEFTPDFLVKMLNTMADHARYLRWYYTRQKNYFNVSPNWGLMESNGLAHMGILFPEFREANDWKEISMSRLEEQVRMQVLEDGMQIERAAGYHLVCTFCLLQILDLAMKNNVDVSRTYRDNVEKMVDFIARIMKPHGHYPVLKDGDESDVFGNRCSYGLWEDINNLNMLEDSNDLRWVLKTGARIFNRPDFLYIATHGKRGEKPVKKSVAAEQAGYYTMRTGWDNDDLYLVFTCGKLGAIDQSAVHGMADALNIDVSGYGETLLLNPGRYIYEGPYRIWFKGTKARNTIAVDNKDSSELADEWKFRTMAEGTLHSWSTTDKFDYVDGTHNGYERLEDPVTHRRRICFIKPYFWVVLDNLTAEKEHTYDQYFHFGENAELTRNKDLEIAAKYNNGAGIILKPANTENTEIEQFKGSTDPIQGWISYDYAVKISADVIKYTKRDKSTYFATLLLPFKNSAPEYEFRAVEENAFELKYENKTYLIIFSDGKQKTYKDFTFDAEMLCVQFDTKGKLTECCAAKASKITYKDNKLLDSVVHKKTDYCG